MGLMDSNGFSPAYQSLPIVSKGLRDSKEYPIVSINTAFSLAYPSLSFVPKWLMYSKRYPLDSFNTVVNMLVHPFPLSLSG